LVLGDRWATSLYLVDREEKSFATLSVLFFRSNNALAHRRANPRPDLALLPSKKHTATEPKNFLIIDYLPFLLIVPLITGLAPSDILTQPTLSGVTAIDQNR
jgi:hypothetical protein